MISKDTILSIFNEKGTLLKWLQKLEKAYTGAELTNVEITQTNPLTAIFTFLFEDGSTVNSSPITLPQGPAGKDGVNGTNGADGAPGKDGNGIVSIVSGAPYISGDKTITPVTIETDESTENLTVEAQNGKDGVNGTNGADGFIQHIAQFNKYSDDNITIMVFKRYNDNTDTTLKKGSYVMIVDQSNYNDSIIGLVPEYVGEDTPFIGNSIELPVTDFAIANYTLNLRGEQGIAGTDGVGIESITTLGYRAGSGANIGYTETMLKAHMSDNTDIEFSAFAKDGIDNTQQLLTDIKIANLGKYNVFAENTNNYGFTYNDTSEKFKAKKFYLTNSSDTSSQSISISTSGATISSSKILYCVEKGRFLTNSELLGKSETLTLIVFQKENLTITIS